MYIFDKTHNVHMFEILNIFLYSILRNTNERTTYMTSNIVIYTQDDCPPCTFVKNYLSEQGVDFIEKNIKNNQYRNEMIDYDAFATPFILLNNEPMYSVDMDKINSTLNLNSKISHKNHSTLSFLGC